MPIIVNLPLNIRNRIRNYYNTLYNERRLKYPYSTTYTRAQLRNNIRKALSIHGSIITELDIKQPIYNDWLSMGFKEIRDNNWHYAIILKKDKKGKIIAIVQDAHHKNDNHNDTLTTKPYESIGYKMTLSLIERLERIKKV